MGQVAQDERGGKRKTDSIATFVDSGVVEDLTLVLCRANMFPPMCFSRGPVLPTGEMCLDV